jgi:hypothetical protein
MRLIANKPAWVRVYVRSRFTTSISGVTGTLEVQQRRLAAFYETVYTPPAEFPGTVTAEINPNYADERGNLKSSLNFIIPSDYMMGHMRLRVKISTGSLSDELDVYLDVTLRQTLHLAGIMISYEGPEDNTLNSPNVTYPAPTMTDLQQTAAETIRLMPVQSNATYRIAGSLTWKKPLFGRGRQVVGEGGCPKNHLDLNVEVAKQIDSDQNRPDVIYYGLFPKKMPGSTGAGCSTMPEINGIFIKAASGPSQAPWTMAHELGHYLGLGHAPCDAIGGPTLGSNFDHNYPAYEPYDSVPLLAPGSGTGTGTIAIAHGIIGEYALNLNDGGTIYPPTSYDLMSYCPFSCFGLYHYGLLILHQLLDPTFIDDTPWWFEYVTMVDPHFPPELWLPDPPLSDPLHFSGIKVNAKVKARNPESLISVIGLVHSNKEIEVRSIVRLQAFSNLVEGKESEFVVELVDMDGKILSTAPLYKMPSSGYCNSCRNGKDNPLSTPYVFQAFLEDVAAGALIRISRHEKEIWVRHAPSTPVHIQSFTVSVSKHGSVVVVNWNLKASSDQEPEVWLQWSEDKDRGKIWHGLATGLMGKRVELDISILPPGPIRLRMLANDGFYTATSRSVSIKVPDRPPSVAILYPHNNTKIPIKGTLRLWGVCTDSYGKSVNPESVTWLINNKKVAIGFDVFVTAPAEGKHRITLRVVVNRKTIEQAIQFEMVALPHMIRNKEELE